MSCGEGTGDGEGGKSEAAKGRIYSQAEVDALVAGKLQEYELAIFS
jgi:hypothetical protein